MENANKNSKKNQVISTVKFVTIYVAERVISKNILLAKNTMLTKILKMLTKILSTVCVVKHSNIIQVYVVI